MDLNQQFQVLKVQVQQWIEQAKAYFRQLNQMEQYGWMAMGLGFVLLISGVIIF
jgi:hypothetical protein